MPFPASPRVVYSRNPLDEVICQIRFPQNLEVQANPPVALQRKLRDAYPEFATQSDEVIWDSQVRIEQSKTYRFGSKNAQWQLSLASGFVALSTCAYSTWSDFRGRIHADFNAVNEIYRPPYVTRIGLRYRNVLRPSVMGIERPTNWGRYVKPELAGEVAAIELFGEVQSSLRETLINLPTSGGKVRIRHGLAETLDENPELVYLIDADLFIDAARVPMAEAYVHLDAFNREAGNLFRWFITEATASLLMVTP